MRYFVGGMSFSDELWHFGIKGMSWGRRRFQNEDGSLTAEGRARYGYGNDRRNTFDASSGNKYNSKANAIVNPFSRVNRYSGNPRVSATSEFVKRFGAPTSYDNFGQSGGYDRRYSADPGRRLSVGSSASSKSSLFSRDNKRLFEFGSKKGNSRDSVFSSKPTGEKSARSGITGMLKSFGNATMKSDSFRKTSGDGKKASGSLFNTVFSRKLSDFSRLSDYGNKFKSGIMNSRFTRDGAHGLIRSKPQGSALSTEFSGGDFRSYNEHRFSDRMKYLRRNSRSKRGWNNA